MDTFWGLSATAWTAIYTLLTLGLLIVAVAAALVAWRQWKASREQIADSRRAALEASRPYVVVSAAESRASQHLFDLSIRNMGKRPALGVSVRLDPPPRRARETHDEFIIANIKMLNEPIGMLAPGQEMRTFWDNHIERRDRDDLPAVHKVTLSYKDTSGRTYAEESVIDLDAMRGGLFTRLNTVHTIGASLDELVKVLKNASVLAQDGSLDVTSAVETYDQRRERTQREEIENYGQSLRTQLWATRMLSEESPGKARDIAALETRLRAWAEQYPELATEEDYQYGVPRTLEASPDVAEASDAERDSGEGHRR